MSSNAENDDPFPQTHMSDSNQNLASKTDAFERVAFTNVTEAMYDDDFSDSNSDIALSSKLTDEDSNSAAIESILTQEQLARIKQKVQLKKNQLVSSNKQTANESFARIQNEDFEDFDFSDYSGSDLEDQDDVYDMIDDSLNDDELKKSECPPHEERKKTVLKKRENDYFEMLPEGWIEITHSSGMPVYLHKPSRVCTFAKPYYLGPGSARQHEVPISAIPCLSYRKQLEKERIVTNEIESKTDLEELVEPKAKRMKTDDSTLLETELTLTNVTDLIEIDCEQSIESKDKFNQQDLENAVNEKNKKGRSFSAKVETIKESKKEKSLNGAQVREYCAKVFEFQEITIRKFKTWADRRKHLQLRKMAQRPSLPEGTKLITCPMPKGKEASDASGRNLRKEFVMNPAGKSSVCILHEFVQHTERVQPKYVFKELENASTPYSATVVINSMQYGIGYGSSKKQAKSEAAKATLEILIPDMRELSESSKKPDTTAGDLSFFDEIKVEDPRVSELCAKAGQHSPYQILVECLRRNCGMGDTDITTSVRLVKHQKNEFTMKVGEHVATVICRNKREGKQRAAQAILQLLHPQISNWGSLLRLYGRGSCKTPKEKKEEEQKITELQNTASTNKPNYAILNKLREEMLKLRQTENTITPFAGMLPTIKNNETNLTETPD